jgi:hypothetical protein
MILKTLGAVLLLGMLSTPVLAQNRPGGPPPASSSDPPIAEANRPLTPADLQDLRAALRASRKQIVAQNLRLTPDEATRFWPVYDQYIGELTKINDSLYQLIAEYANTYGKYDDKAASAFIGRWLDIDVKTSSLRARYAPLVAKVLPGIKATTFFQIDRRTAMSIDRRIADQLPILQYQALK